MVVSGGEEVAEEEGPVVNALSDEDRGFISTLLSIAGTRRDIEIPCWPGNTRISDCAADLVSERRREEDIVLLKSVMDECNKWVERRKLMHKEMKANGNHRFATGFENDK